MNSPYYHLSTSSYWWTRPKSSSKSTKDKSPEATTLPRTYSGLQADGLAPDQPSKPSSMFGNFTSAIRLKPKKNVQAIAIQEPPKVPSPLIIPPPNSAEPYGPLTSRPFSKAVSAVTITDEDSIEPRTPPDLKLPHQRSLMGTDPFAATTGVIFSPKEPRDLDQLFVPPDTHDTPASLRTTHRRPNTANSSPIRERLVSESTPSSPRLAANRPRMTIRTQLDVLNTRARKVSMNDIPAPLPVISPIDATKPATYGRSMSKGTDGPRPHTRPRGMTDNSGVRPPLGKDADRPSLSRQSSLSRSVITPPETSPPSQTLPPVPSLKHLAVLPNSDGSPLDPVSSSSSSLSFPSSISESELMSRGVCVEDRRLRSIRNQAKVPSEPRTKSPTRVLREALSPTLSRRPGTADNHPQLLKKMPSQPSIQNKFTGRSSPYPDDQSLGVDDILGSTKPLKKQRSFHHSRVPVPPLPYPRHAPSFTPSEGTLPQSVDLSKDREKEKRESAASPSRRRFLPGSMRQISASHLAAFTFDDDTGSLIIPPAEFDRLDRNSPPRFTNPFGSPGVESMMLPATSTFYDDLAGSPTAGSHFPQSAEIQPQDTGPQRILSAAQLLKLEEMLESDEPDMYSDSSNRTSPAELGSPNDSSPVNPPPFEEFGFGNRSPPKKHSWTDSIVSASTVFSSTLSDKIMLSDRVETGSTLSFFDQQQHPGYRPRTTSSNLPPLDFSIKRNHSTFSSSSQSTVSMSMGIESTFGIEPNQPLGGLTPPPRPRPKVIASPKSTKSSSKRESVAHIQPLSPPPLRRNPTSTSTSSRSTSSRSSPLSTPRSPPPSFKNDTPTKGILKKPSFLEIDDDLEADARLRVQVMIGGDIHQRSTSISSVDDSFLDLGRENNSFETIRTLSMEGPG